MDSKDGEQVSNFCRELENGFLERFEVFKKQIVKYVSGMVGAYEKREREEKANLTQKLKRLENEKSQAYQELEDEKNRALERIRSMNKEMRELKVRFAKKEVEAKKTSETRESELEKGIGVIEIMKSQKDGEVEQTMKVKEEVAKMWEKTKIGLREEIRNLKSLLAEKDKELKKVRGVEDEEVRENGEEEEREQAVEKKEELDGERSEEEENEEKKEELEVLEGEMSENKEVSMKNEEKKERESGEKNVEIEEGEKESENRKKLEEKEKGNEYEGMEKEESGKEEQEEKKEKKSRKDVVPKKLPGAENKIKAGEGRQKKEKSVDDRSKPRSGRNKGRQGKRKKYASGGAKKWGKKKKKNYKKKSKSKSKKMSASEVRAEEDKLLEKMRVATERKRAKMKEKTEKKKQEVVQETTDTSVEGDVPPETNKETKSAVDEFLGDLPNEVVELYKETDTKLSYLKEILEKDVEELRDLAFDSAWGGIDKKINRILAFTIYEFLDHIDELDAAACFSHGLLLIGGRSRSPGYCVCEADNDKGMKFLKQAESKLISKIHLAKNRGQLESLEPRERVLYWKFRAHAFVNSDGLDALDVPHLKETIDLKGNLWEYSHFDKFVIATTLEFLVSAQQLGKPRARVKKEKEQGEEDGSVEKSQDLVQRLLLRAVTLFLSGTQGCLANACIAIVDVFLSNLPKLFSIPANSFSSMFPRNPKLQGKFVETLMRQAAELCEPRACFRLAIWYEYGLSKPKSATLMNKEPTDFIIKPDFGKAREYYEKARRLGYVYAKKSLLRMQERMKQVKEEPSELEMDP